VAQLKTPSFFPSAKTQIETYITHEVILGNMSSKAEDMVSANIGSAMKAKIIKYKIPISGTIQEAFKKKIEEYEKEHPKNG